MRVAVGAVLVSAYMTATSAPITLKEPAERWHRHTRAERMAWAAAAASSVDMCRRSANCNQVELMACIDAATEPPVPEAMRGESIAAITTGCIAMLR